MRVTPSAAWRADPERLKGRAWYPKVEVAAGDVTHPETLPAAMQGVSAAYYLIHSMSAGHGYDRVDLQSARNFAQAAKAAGVEHIIYLGGLADPRDPGPGPAPEIAHRKRRGPARGGRAGHRIPRGRHRRPRLGLVRDDPLHRRAIPADGRPATGCATAPSPSPPPTCSIS